jgi:hypothetical protein
MWLPIPAQQAAIPSFDTSIRFGVRHQPVAGEAQRQSRMSCERHGRRPLSSCKFNLSGSALRLLDDGVSDIVMKQMARVVWKHGVQSSGFGPLENIEMSRKRFAPVIRPPCPLYAATRQAQSFKPPNLFIGIDDLKVVGPP